jgi:hypothetical protein
LSDLPESIDLDTAKAALEQVNKRLDAEMALKSSTETRADARRPEHHASQRDNSRGSC